MGPPRVPRRLLLLVSPLVVALGVLTGRVLCTHTPARSESSPEAPGESVLRGETVRLLVVGDPFASALEEAATELQQLAGGTIELEVVGYDDVRRLTLRNAQDKVSAYDLISFDGVWAGEYGELGVFLPLEARIASAHSLVEPEDFLDIAYAQSRYREHQLGLPIQSHPELLWYRKDWFAEDGLSPPETTEALLQVARHYYKPDTGRYGIVWNGQRGQAFGQQMAHFYAAFGQPLLDTTGRPTLNTPRGVAAARFALELLTVSPPDVVNTAWDQRPRRIAQGGVAMTYEWAARAFLVEESPASSVAGKIGYAPAPHAAGVEPVTPMGTWSLGIPANIGPRAELAFRALSWLTSPQVLKVLARHGNGGMPRKSLLADAELVHRYPVFSVVSRLAQAGQLQDWMRPAVPQWPQLAEILGTTYHDMLLGQLTPEQAASQAQQRAEALFALHAPGTSR